MNRLQLLYELIRDRVIEADRAALPARELRFVLEFQAPPDLSIERTRIAELLGSTAFVLAPLASLPALRTFAVLRFPGIERTLPPRTLFDIAHSLRAELSVVTVEPDVGTDFFIDPDAARNENAVESTVVTGTCWVKGEPPADLQWALRSMRIVDAWQLSQGAGVFIAQPDTGIAEHVELEGAVDTERSFDILQGKPGALDPLDEKTANPGHGTGTASVVVSRSAGSVVGAAPAAALVPIRCIDDVKVSDPSPVAAAIAHAIEQGCDIISLSLGGLPSRALKKSIEAAIDAGMIVIAAAGNCVRMVVWPARYDDVIAVGGTNVHGEIWKGSCRGRDVDICAPAENVWRAERQRRSDPKDKVGGGQGTSFATALTAGAAALWLSANGRESVAAEAKRRGVTVQRLFRAALTQTAQTPQGWDHDDFGAGIVDAHALVSLPLEAITVARSEGVSGARPEAAKLLDSVMPPSKSDLHFDWNQFGMELANIVLTQAKLGASAAEISREAKAYGTRPSPALSRAVNESADPQLQVFGEDERTSASHSLGINPTAWPEGGSPNELHKAARVTPEVARTSDRLLLEALIRIDGRPAFRVTDDNDLDEAAFQDTEWGTALTFLKHSGKLQQTLQCVGRIDVDGVHVGTGFLIGTELIATNRHVIQEFAAAVPRRNDPDRWVITADATIDFSARPRSSSPKFRITEIVGAGRDEIGEDADFRHLDLAIVRVEKEAIGGASLPAKPLKLSSNPDDISQHSQVFAVGYPARPAKLPTRHDGSLDEQVVQRLLDLYQSTYGVKYVSPGTVSVPAGKVVNDPIGWVFGHDATTLNGNSGSCVIAVDGANHVVAIHFAGAWRINNWAHAIPILRSANTFLDHDDVEWAP